MTVIVLEPPAALINANRRLHHHAKAKLTKAWRQAALIAVLRGDSLPYYERAHVTVAIRFPTNHRRDAGNFYPTAKACLDGLVDAGLLPDDNDDHVTGPDMRRTRPNGPLQVTITIREIPMSLTDLFGADTAAWAEGAKCANADNPDAWFPVSEARALPVAKALCAGCPVVNDCLAYALERPELEGIWGGTTDAQRAQLRGDTSALPTRIQCGTQAGIAQHKRRSEPRCRPCRAAQAEYKREWNRRRKEGAA